MRQRKANLRARVNGDLAVRFTAAGLTSYSGLEVFRCYLRKLDFTARLRRRLKTIDPGADYSSVDFRSRLSSWIDRRGPSVPESIRRGPGVTIDFGLDHEIEVHLSIYDVTGRRIRDLVQEALPLGSHKRVWDGLDERGGRVAAGVYVFKLEAGETSLTRKVVKSR